MQYVVMDANKAVIGTADSYKQVVKLIGEYLAGDNNKWYGVYKLVEQGGKSGFDDE